MATKKLAKPSAPAEVDKYMKALKHPRAEVLEALRQIILKAHPEVGEEIKWNAPSFFFTGEMAPSDPKLYQRYLVISNVFKKDCIRLVFWGGAKAKDPTGLLEGSYADGRRLAMFYDMDDVKAKGTALRNIVRSQIKALLIVLGLAVGPSLEAQQATASILGRWHGHSICIKADWNASCNDEVVVYRFVPSAAGGQQVTMRGFKIVNGAEDWMGDIEMTPDSRASQWSGEFSNARVHIRFTFIMTGDSLRGTLAEVPGGRVHRNMTAVRDSAAAP